MEKVTDIRQGVEKLLTIRGKEIPEFSLEQRQEDGFTPILLWEGKRIPLFTTRYDPRIRHIAAYGTKTEDNRITIKLLNPSIIMPPPSLLRRTRNYKSCYWGIPRRKILSFWDSFPWSAH